MNLWILRVKAKSSCLLKCVSKLFGKAINSKYPRGARRRNGVCFSANEVIRHDVAEGPRGGFRHVQTKDPAASHRVEAQRPRGGLRVALRLKHGYEVRSLQEKYDHWINL